MSGPAPLTKFQEDQTCIKIYDIDTKQVLHVFSNYKQAATYLKVEPATISRRCNSKKRLFVPSLNKEVACRLTKAD